jgi:hypothetical protein
MAVNSPNINIIVTLYRPKQDNDNEYTSYQIWPREQSIKDSYVSLEEIVLNEDMYSGSIYGALSFVDSSNILDQFNFTTNEWLQLTLDGNVYNTRISEIKIESNIAQKTTHGPSGTPIKIILNFLSDEFVNRNFDTGIDDFIGKISKKGPGDDGTIAVAREDMVLNPYNRSIIIPSELKNKEKGLVQLVMKQASAKSKKPLAAHETFNDIWFKTSFTFYPYQKDANSLRITHLMNYVCEYACYKGNENAANFFFWEDLDQWNFKCIEGLIEEQKQAIENFTLPTKEGETSTLPVFKPHLDELSENAMLSMEVLNDFNINYLLDSGAAFSTYDRIKPNWANPYRGFVDINQSFTTKTINYNYALDLNKWYDIRGKKQKGDKTSIFKKSITFINNDLGTPKYIKDETTGEFKLDPKSVGDPKQTPHGYTGDKLLAFNNYSFNAMVDNLFGFYSAPYNSNHISHWQIKSFNHTTEKEYWQSQFNFCELPGAILLLINGKDGIKEKAALAGVTFADLKNKKATWDVYRKKMCCERQVPSNFFAVLIDAEKIHGSTGNGSYPTQDPGGIWKYTWAEVELWPQEKTPEGENLLTEMLNTGHQIIEFESEETDFPFVFVMPPAGFQGYPSDTYKQNVISAGGGDGPSGNKIEEVEITSKDNRAFNLNELLNSRIPLDFEAETPSGNDGSTLLMNPGVSAILTSTPDDPDVIKKSSYPQKTQMLPVGKFRVISNKCPNFLDNGQDPTAADNGFYYAGRIVQMSAVPKETIQTIILYGVNNAPSQGFDPEKVKDDEVLAVNRDYMFLFDVENAHDGFCSTCD